jgi:hypothetical protein
LEEEEKRGHPRAHLSLFLSSLVFVLLFRLVW